MKEMREFTLDGLPGKNQAESDYFSPAPGQVKQCCFTLIELLVVIAIIAILAAILLPALQSARSRGQAAGCLNNMKQQGFLTQQYADRNADFLPWYNANGYMWATYLLDVTNLPGKKVTDSQMKIFEDPALHHASEQLLPYTAGKFYLRIGYGVNFRYLGGAAKNADGVPDTDEYGENKSAKLAWLTAPAKGYWVMDAIAAHWSNASYTRGNYRVIEYTTTGSSAYGYPDAKRHRGNLNILYVDGHAAPTRAYFWNAYEAIGNYNNVHWTAGRRGFSTTKIFYQSRGGYK